MEKSRNLMTVRLAKLVGLDKIKDLSLNFGIYDEFPKLMSSIFSLKLNDLFENWLIKGGKKCFITHFITFFTHFYTLFNKKISVSWVGL